MADYLHYKSATVTIQVGALQGVAPNYGAAGTITCHVDDFAVNFTTTSIDAAGRCDDTSNEIIVRQAGVLTMTLRIPSTGFAAPTETARQVKVTIKPGAGVPAVAYEGVITGSTYNSPASGLQTQALTISINAFADVE